MRLWLPSVRRLVNLAGGLGRVPAGRRCPQCGRRCHRDRWGRRRGGFLLPGCSCCGSCSSSENYASATTLPATWTFSETEDEEPLPHWAAAALQGVYTETAGAWAQYEARAIDDSTDSRLQVTLGGTIVGSNGRFPPGAEVLVYLSDEGPGQHVRLRIRNTSPAQLSLEVDGATVDSVNVAQYTGTAAPRMDWFADDRVLEVRRSPTSSGPADLSAEIPDGFSGPVLVEVVTPINRIAIYAIFAGCVVYPPCKCERPHGTPMQVTCERILVDVRSGLNTAFPPQLVSYMKAVETGYPYVRRVNDVNCSGIGGVISILESAGVQFWRTLDLAPELIINEAGVVQPYGLGWVEDFEWDDDRGWLPVNPYTIGPTRWDEPTKSGDCSAGVTFTRETTSLSGDQVDLFTVVAAPRLFVEPL